MCTVSVLNEITARVVQAARDILGDKLHRVILYGSYARGDQDDESDIDILVLADIPMEETSGAREKIRDILPAIGVEYGVVLSLCITPTAIFYRRLNVLPFYGNVLADGVVLCA
jgi:predicted nucleotidyltransferase